MTNIQKAGETNLQNFINSPNIQARISEVLGRRSAQFTSSLINIANSDNYLKNANPVTLLTAAMQAAVLDLPIEKGLGFAYIVPYKGQAQFQMGYRGYIQLAQRTGLYQKINVTDIREGELKGWNPLTEDIELEFILDQSERANKEIIGYAGYFRMVNGYEKTVYWTVEELEAHGKKYSKSYNSKSSLWKNNFDAMARKTVLKLMISKWGMMSVDVQSNQLYEAIQADQAVINNIKTKDYVYVDNQQTEEDEDVISLTAEEVAELEAEAKELEEEQATEFDEEQAESLKDNEIVRANVKNEMVKEFGDEIDEHQLGILD